MSSIQVLPVFSLATTVKAFEPRELLQRVRNVVCGMQTLLFLYSSMHKPCNHIAIIDRKFVTSAKKIANFNELSEI